jgi:hypothetical protein
MRKSIPSRAYYSVLLLFLGFGALAQQGHPLTGTWSGDWGSAPGQRTAVTFVLKWDGQKITGIINPGPDSIPLAGASLDLAKWTVRFEADGKDGSGKPAHIVAEGKLEEIASYHRTIKGTWQQGAVNGDFKLTRD